MAWVYKKDYVNTAYFLKRAAEVYKKFQSSIDPKEAFAVHNVLGNVYACLGFFESAKASLLEACKIAEKEKLIYEEAKAYNNLGYLCRVNNQPKEAKEFFQQGLELLEKIPSTNETQSLKNAIKKNKVFIQRLELISK